MDSLNKDSRGTMVRHGRGWRINNALVEERHGSERNGYLLVSYAVIGPNNIINIELLRLNIGRNTIITNQFGHLVSLRSIDSGMWIDAEFSSAMTRSIPPQANAFRIVVQQRNMPDPFPASITTTTRVVRVDVQNKFLITGDRNDMNRQRRFVVTDETKIIDRNGNRIQLRSLRPGQKVRITYATFQTPSIPPQTTAFRIQLV